LVERGNSAGYLVRRLKRDHPQIAQALARGEYRSVRAAAIEAGIVKVPTPLEQLRKDWKKASSEEREIFRQEIES
jgi:chemotaxis response regulator CheB